MKTHFLYLSYITHQRPTLFFLYTLPKYLFPLFWVVLFSYTNCNTLTISNFLQRMLQSRQSWIVTYQHYSIFYSYTISILQGRASSFFNVTKKKKCNSLPCLISLYHIKLRSPQYINLNLSPIVNISAVS